MTTENNNKDLVATLKGAGLSARDVVEEFATRFREDRAATTPSTAANYGTTEQTGNLVDRATEFVKDMAGSVSRAAEATRATPAFTDAKDKIGTAFTEAKSTVEEKVKKKDAPNTTPPQDNDIIDGEVINPDNPQ